MRIVLIGSLPPPVGGVSIHLSRLLEEIKKYKNIKTVEVVQPGSTNTKIKGFGYIKFFFYLLSKRADLYHHHKPERSLGTLILLVFLSFFGKKIIVTVHNEDLADDLANNSIGKWKKKFIRYAYDKFDHIICVNTRMAESLVKLGVKETHVSVIPAFIPVDKVNAESLPQDIKTFVKSHSPVLVGYASKIYLYNGFDRYGGDMMLELTLRLKESYPNIGMIIVIPNPDDENRKKIAVYEEYISRNSLEEQVNICLDSIDLTSLFSLSDIHVRPSNTDGDPIAVRESLYLDVPTVASDCTYKPEGTVFHKDRDIEDMEKQVSYIIDNLEEEKAKLTKLEKNSFGEQVISIYVSTVNS